MATSKSYHIKLPGGAMVTFGSPEAIKESLEVHWPAGRYDIHEGPSAPAYGRAGRRWGDRHQRVERRGEPGPRRRPRSLIGAEPEVFRGQLVRQGPPQRPGVSSCR
jgi:hypothetical protein